MKKLLIFLLVANMYVYSQFSGGKGTAGNEYLIGSKEDIYALIDSINAETETKKYSDKHYKVIKNIRDSVRKCIPFFSGNWNGQGYKVTLALNNYKSENNKYNHCGLFSYVQDALLRNIVIDGYIKDDSSYSQFLGGVVGYAKTTYIYNCVNLAKIIATNPCVAGICGHFEFGGKIENCINLGKIESYSVYGTTFIGGLVGHYIYSIFQDYKGPIIIKSINAAFIKTKIGWSAGLIGLEEVKNVPTIFNSISTGIIECEEKINGISNTR